MFKSGLWKSVATLLTGSVGAQVLLLVTYFLLAKWYGPDGIGELRIYTSITLTMAILVSASYELALMLTETERETQTHIKLCLRIAALVTVVLLPIGFFFSDSMAEWLQSPSLSFWGKILPISILMEGLINLFHQYLTKKERYKQLSFAIFIYGACFSVVALTSSQRELNVDVLFTALVIAQFVKLLLYLWQYQKSKSSSFVLEPGDIKKQANKFKEYPTYHLGSAMANYGSRELVSPMLSSFFGPAVTGLYAMANQILFLPMRFLMQVVPQVFYQRIAAARKLGQQAVRKETISALVMLLLVSTIPTFLLAIFGPDLFSTLLGEKWAVSGEFIKWLILFAIISSMASPLTGMFNIKFKLKPLFFLNVGLLVTRLGAIYVGGKLGSSDTAIALFGSVAALGAGAMLLWILWLSGVIGNRKNTILDD